MAQTFAAVPDWVRWNAAKLARRPASRMTHERALDIVPLEALREHAVDVPADPGSLG